MRSCQRLFIATLCLLAAAAVVHESYGQSPQAASPGKKIPVIFDTDIGGDIDDTWALGMLLKRPEFDVKLVVGDYGQPEYRAKLLARFLEKAGRADIPVGVGMEFDAKSKEAQAEWVEGYDLEKYPGKVYRDGVQAIIDTIMQSPEPITLIAVGPLPNIAEAFRREPRIAEKARFVGMHGALRVGYRRSPKVAAEWNVRAAPAACAAAFAAPWEVTITPLDTCDQVQLDGELYQKVLASRDPIAQMIVENYRIWAKSHPTNDPTVRSSVLFDTVAVYLGFSEELLKMETLGVRVTDEGMTVIDPEAKKLRAATAWKDLDAFESLLVRTITGE